MKKETLLSSELALIEDEVDVIANLANLSALLNQYFQDINWVGFYLYKEEQCILGPFQGKPACIRIPLTKGVCGKAATSKTMQNIPDVHQFPGHVACDEASRSEIVVPILVHNQLFALLDIDSPFLNRFSKDDEEVLAAFVLQLEKHLEKNFISEV
ncbi:MAG: GAF domain-containing protein [Erysipelotrichaceae bacterium]